MHHVFCALLVLFGLALPGDGNVPRIEIRLANVRWPALPCEVVRTTVVPDGKTWYQINPGRWHTDNLTLFKRRIAREFSEQSPQY